MKAITLKLYDYIELSDEAKIKVAEEWYYNDGGDFVYFETNNLLDCYIDRFIDDLGLCFGKDDFNFYEHVYTTKVNLKAGELEYSVFKNNAILDKYVDEHATSKRLKVLLKHFDVQYYWNNKQIEVDCISGIDDSKYYERCEKYLVEELPKVLQPVSDKINEILDDFNHDLHNLQCDIRGYLGDDTINGELNNNGWYFTKEGEFTSNDEVDELIDKLELIEKAYNVKFNVEEK